MGAEEFSSIDKSGSDDMKNERKFERVFEQSFNSQHRKRDIPNNEPKNDTADKHWQLVSDKLDDGARTETDVEAQEEDAVRAMLSLHNN